MPALRARAALASLRPASEVVTSRPLSTSSAPTALPMAPGAITATTGFMLLSCYRPGSTSNFGLAGSDVLDTTTEGVSL